MHVLTYMFITIPLTCTVYTHTHTQISEMKCAAIEDH